VSTTGTTQDEFIDFGGASGLLIRKVRESHSRPSGLARKLE
jgi:hypothetical protein